MLALQGMRKQKHQAAWSVGAVACLSALLACGGESNQTGSNTPHLGGSANAGAGGDSAQAGNGSGGGAGGSVAQAGNGNGGGAGASVSGQVTYWQDIVPIAEEHCMECHQEDGLGPNLIGTYQAAEAAGEAIRNAVEARVMPPWDALDDGTCGTFSDSKTLSAQEIATIGAWVDGGKLEGTPATINVPAQPSLNDATEYSTPAFVPMPEGSFLAANDEYRCFIVDNALTAEKFITGYDVVPGVPALIHHVIGFLVDPAADSGVAGMSNDQQMQALDAESPDRLGWPCFGMAGDGVEVKSVPVTWAPGQGIVSYPGESGVPFAPTDRFVVQVHYNMDNANLIGMEDTTLIRLRLADSVPRIGIFVLHDPFLESLSSFPANESLAAGQASVPYTWQADITQLGLSGGLADLQLNGVMPHMHKLGHTYNLTLSDTVTPAPQCGIQVPDWDIHWQRMYFYENGIPMSHTTSFEVTCDFDTTEVTSTVTPGWGTSNEMCLAVLYFTGTAP